MDRYRVVSPDGEQQTLELEKGASLAEAYIQVAFLLGRDARSLTLLLRNAPGSALPTMRLPEFGEAELEPLWRHAVPGSVLLVELDGTDPAAPPPEPVTESLQKKSRKERSERSGLLGLRNMGNTCYLNSAVQCLSQTPLLQQALLQQKERGPTCRALAETFETLEEADDAPAPARLKACVAASHRIFAGSGQQDAQEFLQCLLEALHSELQTVDEPGGSGVADADGPSAIRDIFEGRLRSELCCACGSREVAEDPFWSLPLQVPISEASVDQVMESFCSTETLEGWSCDRCETPAAAAATRRLQLQHVPKVLQLHLKRFQWNAPAVSQPPTTKAPADEAKQNSQASSAVARAAAATPEEKTAEEEAPPEEWTSLPPLERVSKLPWEKQEKIYALLLRVLERLRDQPEEPKFRSLSATSAKLQQELLEPPGGEALLLWCGFVRTGQRYLVDDAKAPDFGPRHAELLAHATSERDRAFRAARDQRIQAEKLKALPSGDFGPPLRRWGGRLPSFGAGAQRLAGMQCSKIMTRIFLPLDPHELRGFVPLQLLASTYRLSAVVQHLGATPFAGHYVAYCWNHVSSRWYCFDDSRVRCVEPEVVAKEALNDGAYVLFFELDVSGD